TFNGSDTYDSGTATCGTATFGTVSTFKLQINKFSGVKGFWFVYKLLIKNHVDREKIGFISIFMEDETCNNRISIYLENNLIETTQVIPNFKCDERINIYADNSLNEAKKKANDIFTATKLMWLEEIKKYEKKTEDYFRLKENAIKNIQVDNIRTSKLQSLSKEKKEEERKFQLKKNIIPKLELYQIAFVEFL
ncbi:MAG: hypothetical protein HQK78_19805, partial [Desulfobacterales bacterium]|nr:hypothetical protein [Desulfobacterales bacterium]